MHSAPTESCRSSAAAPAVSGELAAVALTSPADSSPLLATHRVFLRTSHHCRLLAQFLEEGFAQKLPSGWFVELPADTSGRSLASFVAVLVSELGDAWSMTAARRRTRRCRKPAAWRARVTAPAS